VTPAERAQRAVGVRALLDDQNVKDGFAAIEGELVAEWKRCHDAHERDNLWRTVQLMERLQAWLRSAASHDLTALRRQK
jgi:hypothetical protein